MKTMKYILIVLFCISSVAASAVVYGNYGRVNSNVRRSVRPRIYRVESGMVSEFRSTSPEYRYAGRLSMAANDGVALAAMPEPSMGETTVGKSPSRPRRVWGTDDDDEEDTDEEGDDGNMSGNEGGLEDPAPLGATPWLLMLLLAGGYGYLLRRKKQ